MEDVRVTTKEVEILPKVKVGQIWRQNDGKASFVVVAIRDGVVTFARPGFDEAMIVLGVFISDFRKKFTLIQGVVKVAE